MKLKKYISLFETLEPSIAHFLGIHGNLLTITKSKDKGGLKFTISTKKIKSKSRRIAYTLTLSDVNSLMIYLNDFSKGKDRGFSKYSVKLNSDNYINLYPSLTNEFMELRFNDFDDTSVTLDKEAAQDLVATLINYLDTNKLTKMQV